MALFKLVDAYFCFLFPENIMLKDDVKKRFKNKKKNNKQKLKLDKKKEKMRSLHIFSTILLISHYLHQTKLEIRRCFQ